LAADYFNNLEIYENIDRHNFNRLDLLQTPIKNYAKSGNIIMARIVFAWEFGSGLGHIQRILTLARVMQQRNHTVYCIMKHVIAAGNIFGDQNINIMQAPLWQVRVKQLPTSYSYAETLFNLGYLVPGALLSMVKAWRNLLETVKPDLLVADHSPTALIATHGGECKRVLLGNGFFSPPRKNPMPTIIPWIKTPPGLIEYSEQKALQTINRVLQEVGAPLLEHFYNLFETDEDILATFAELDHYQERETARYWGPVINSMEAESPRWPDNKNFKKVFCYIKPVYPLFEELLKGLQQPETSVIVFAPEVSKEVVEKYQSDNLIFLEKPVDMNKVCTTADMVVCHAGVNTVVLALLHGIPLLLLPEHDQQIDQILTARNVVKLKAGIMKLTIEKQKDFKGLIHKILNEPQFSEKAKQFARQYRDFNSASQLEEIADRFEELIKQ
jgi:UDP:flavonoid glycosyltransferase YjiC (YdhE family)